MADEATKKGEGQGDGEGNNAGETKTEKDPYEGLSAEERTEAERLEAEWGRATPAQRVQFARFASLGVETAKKARETGSGGNAKPPEGKKFKSKPADDEEDDGEESETAQLRREMKELRGKLDAREAKEDQEHFETAVAEAIKNYPGGISTKAAGTIRKAALLTYLQNKAQGAKTDPKAAVKDEIDALAEHDSERENKRKEGRLDGKIKDRRSLGESGGSGGVPAKGKEKPKAGDMMNGEFLRRVRSAAD